MGMGAVQGDGTGNMGMTGSGCERSRACWRQERGRNQGPPISTNFFGSVSRRGAATY
jgi:hypothetical protein